MDNRPIGVFDSGVGGLTAIRELHKILPNEDIIYFGDTGRVPYGTRSRRTIVKYASQDVHYLLGHDVKAVLAACGTVSSNLSEADIAAWDLKVPYVGVVPPAVRDACKATRGRVGVIATPATIRSGAFARAIAEASPEAKVFPNACPLLVPLVENGMTAPDNQITRLTLDMYLEPLREAGIDTLILGCTHYPLLTPLIDEFFGGKVALIDTGASSAARMRDLLREQGALSDRKEPGATRYYVTDTVNSFAWVAQNFLEEDVRQVTTFVDLDIEFAI